ncbi:MAG: choice-of-anchor Q domain-containing protein [Anaerolineae bacterium]
MKSGSRGVHKPTTVSSDRTASFSLKNDVAIYGGFIGTETDRDQRDWKTNATVLSGDIDDNDITDISGTVITPSNIRGGNSYHVISNTNVISTAILDGFVITAGQADGMLPHNNGGGMHNNFSSPMLRNITFSGNTATEDGGGMYNTNSSPVLTNVIFSNNTANRGAGMYHFGPSVTWTNVTFSSNTASQDGGGMYNDRSSPTLNRATFRENTAGQNGGGMYNYHSYSKPTLINVVFNRNSADSGGGTYNNGSSPTLVNVTFGNNTANSGGGMYNYFSSSTPVLTNVILWNNSTEISNNGGANPTVAYSDVRGCGDSASWNSSCGNNGGHNIDADPHFVDLAGGNLDLQPDSPCVDAGNNAALPANVTTDLDGKLRIVDGDDNSTAVVDMGAYEVQSPPATPTPIPTAAPTTVPTSAPPIIPTTVITPPHVYLPAVRK